ncbi:MAG: sensor histidine kinase, partial [Oscillospiraceae bacterium]|nr:sensor histidine kinase [Oscillospiraceae bacterium]
LQPIVENAIIHGVVDMEYGYIKISAREDGGDIILTVSDNGKGIDEAVLALLNSPGHQIPGGHLGLNNVDKIIKLYYGANYGTAVYSQPGEGCRVELRLPIEKREEEATDNAESSGG